MEEKRIKAQFSVTSISDDVPQLILNEDALAIKNESNVDITIPFSSINNIKILPVNRIYNPSVGLLKDGFKGFMSHRNSGKFSIYFNYFVDLNIYTNTGNYFFESLDIEENTSKFILKLNDIIKIEDDVNLIALFQTKLIDVNYFTFEPHISVLNSKYGYKKENIYYFVEGKLVEL